MSRLPALLRRLPAADPRPDADLLAAFLAGRDEAAFAELVRRHGPVVWGVCRRHLPDPADAEDAFQAAFLVLVRRGGRVGGSAGVGPWLYKVAAWTARNLRRKNARRLARCGPLPDDVPAPVPVPLPDLDSALLALPEKYRTPLVLCHLQGWSRRDAAAHLGCPEGTLSARLSRGLAKLRDRLAGRDPAPLLAAAAVAVPCSLSAAAARTAGAVVLASASAPPAALELAEGVIRMFRLKKAAAGVAAAMLLTAGLGIGVGVWHAPAAAAAPNAPRAAAPVPRPVAAADRRAIVVAVGGQQSEWPIVVTEHGADGKPAWSVVPHAAAGPRDAPVDEEAWGAAVRKYLLRVAKDPHAPKAVKIVAADDAPLYRVFAAASACRDAGYDEVTFTGLVVDRKSKREADRERFTDARMKPTDLTNKLLSYLLRC